MRKLIILFVTCISLVSFGCLVSPPAGGATGGAAAASKYDATQDAKIDSIGAIVLGPNGLQAIVQAMKAKVDNLPAQQASSNVDNVARDRVSTVEAANSALRQEKDALAARVKTLEDWKATIGTSSGGSSGGSSSVPVAGQVTYNLYKVPDLVYTPGSYIWYLEVMNGTTEYKKVYVSGVLNTVDSAVSTLTQGAAGTRFNSPDLIGGSTDTTGLFSMNFVPTTGITTMASGMSTGYCILKGGEKKMVAIILNLVYTGTAVSRWEAVWSLNAQKYP